MQKERKGISQDCVTTNRNRPYVTLTSCEFIQLSAAGITTDKPVCKKLATAYIFMIMLAFLL